jgi:hypothetical protein
MATVAVTCTALNILNEAHVKQGFEKLGSEPAENVTLLASHSDVGDTWNEHRAFVPQTHSRDCDNHHHHKLDKPNHLVYRKATINFATIGIIPGDKERSLRHPCRGDCRPAGSLESFAWRRSEWSYRETPLVLSNSLSSSKCSCQDEDPRTTSKNSWITSFRSCSEQDPDTKVRMGPIFRLAKRSNEVAIERCSLLLSRRSSKKVAISSTSRWEAIPIFVCHCRRTKICKAYEPSSCSRTTTMKGTPCIWSSEVVYSKI